MRNWLPVVMLFAVPCSAALALEQLRATVDGSPSMVFDGQAARQTLSAVIPDERIPSSAIAAASDGRVGVSLDLGGGGAGILGIPGILALGVMAVVWVLTL